MKLHRAAALAAAVLAAGAATAQQTRIGIRGSLFTINGHPTYTPEGGFPRANTNLIGALLNVRAVQATFDDANYPAQGSRRNPYTSNTMGEVAFDYPDGKWDPDRQTREFIKALPSWRACGLLAFTVNLQGGGPTDGNFAANESKQPHVNTGFEPDGTLKPAYARRLEKVIAAADRLGMAVIVGLFYFGQNERVEAAPDDRFVKRAIENAVGFLKSLPHRNVLIEINNETSARGYGHSILKPDGIVEAVLLAQKAAGGELPVSMSWLAGVHPRGSRADAALRAADYLMIHTNGQTPEQVHESIAAFRRWQGYDKPLLINEDGVSAMNLHAAVEERVGWGYYDQGWNNYRDGFQSPPSNWTINTPVKWVFFEQVARLTGSPIPPIPKYEAPDAPAIKLIGLAPGQTLRERTWVEAVIEDRHPRWPIKRVEFFLDGKPYSYRRNAPFAPGASEWWDVSQLPSGEHTLRVVAYDMRGPRFTETATILETPFRVEK